jgi:hypothetical protein
MILALFALPVIILTSWLVYRHKRNPGIWSPKRRFAGPRTERPPTTLEEERWFLRIWCLAGEVVAHPIWTSDPLEGLRWLSHVVRDFRERIGQRDLLCGDEFDYLAIYTMAVRMLQQQGVDHSQIEAIDRLLGWIADHFLSFREQQLISRVPEWLGSAPHVRQSPFAKIVAALVAVLTAFWR